MYSIDAIYFQFVAHLSYSYFDFFYCFNQLLLVINKPEMISSLDLLRLIETVIIILLFL